MNILQMLEKRAQSTPHARALMAPERADLEYSTLYDHVVRIAASLRRRGIKRDDIIAVVLPTGRRVSAASVVERSRRFLEVQAALALNQSG